MLILVLLDIVRREGGWEGLLELPRMQNQRVRSSSGQCESLGRIMMRQKVRGHWLLPGGGAMSNAFWFSGAGVSQLPQTPGGLFLPSGDTGIRGIFTRDTVDTFVCTLED